MSLYIDLSEFLAVPMKTGIQRISGEICRHLAPNSAIAVRLQSDRFVAFPPALIGAIGRYFRDVDASGIAEIRELGAVENGSAIKMSEGDTVLVPEIFGEHRAAFYSAMPERELQRCRFIVYDMLPMTHPEYFPPYMPVSLAPYYHVVRRASRCGFISEYTRDTYYRRLKRADNGDGVVLPLGCDALGARPGRPTLNRALAFSVLGTIEPRKNPQLILEAFEPLLSQVHGLTLSFIGKMGWVETEFAEKVRALASDKSSGLRFFSAPDDGAIRRHIEQSRATIYLSAAEGYGLPPVESLWVGTPVIASTVIPSLKRLDARGIHYVEPLSVLNLRRAVVSFIDDDYANQKTEETADLDLPTWQSFTEAVLSWCDAGRNSLFEIQ
jgi:glycosyltransferase involved in cell wall biosynthesis